MYKSSNNIRTKKFNYISVIVPFLNEQKYIEKCIVSLLSQNYPKNKYEIIFIDNGSTDKSSEIVKKYKQVILLGEKKPGPYAARNTGIRLAKGKVLAFTDADCVVSKNWLKSIKDKLSLDKNAIVLGKRKFSSSSKGLKLIGLYENAKSEYTVNNVPRKYQFGFTNNMAIRRKYLIGSGLFIEKFFVSSDSEIVQRILRKYPQADIVYSSRTLIFHLEIKTFYQWAKKYFFYGKTPNELKNKNNYHVLPDNYNFAIFSKTINDNNLDILSSIHLLLLLMIKSLSFKVGAILAKFNFI